jgi:hypothetical protein
MIQEQRTHESFGQRGAMQIPTRTPTKYNLIRRQGTPSEGGQRTIGNKRDRPEWVGTRTGTSACVTVIQLFLAVTKYLKEINLKIYGLEVSVQEQPAPLFQHRGEAQYSGSQSVWWRRLLSSPVARSTEQEQGRGSEQTILFKGTHSVAYFLQLRPTTE